LSSPFFNFFQKILFGSCSGSLVAALSPPHLVSLAAGLEVIAHFILSPFWFPSGISITLNNVNVKHFFYIRISNFAQIGTQLFIYFAIHFLLDFSTRLWYNFSARLRAFTIARV
jgi:hypothetical protein